MAKFSTLEDFTRILVTRLPHAPLTYNIFNLLTIFLSLQASRQFQWSSKGGKKLMKARNLRVDFLIFEMLRVKLFIIQFIKLLCRSAEE